MGFSITSYTIFASPAPDSILFSLCRVREQMIISLRTQMGSPPTLGRAGTAPPSPPQLSLPSLLPGHFLRGPWVPGLKDWDGGLRARDTISFYPLATAPTLSLVADRAALPTNVSWKLSASLPLTSPREVVGGVTSD